MRYLGNILGFGASERHTLDVHGGERGSAYLNPRSASTPAGRSVGGRRLHEETTYKGEHVGKVVPPKVGVRQDARDEAQRHGHDGEADEDRVDRDEALVRLDGQAAELRADVLGGCVVR